MKILTHIGNCWKNYNKKIKMMKNLKIASILMNGNTSVYFKDLNSWTPKEELTAIKEKLNHLEKTKIFNELDYRISQSEVIKALKSLKNTEACGFSLILNEMIKYNQILLIPLLTKLFNIIYTTETYPSTWVCGYIIPIHKSGSKCDPSNHRGITIGDTVGKICNQILNNRLKFLKRKRHYEKRTNWVCKRLSNIRSHVYFTNYNSEIW